MDSLWEATPLSEIFDLLPCGVIFARDGRIMTCNFAAAKLLGAARKELLGTPLTNIVPKGADSKSGPNGFTITHGSTRLFCNINKIREDVLLLLEDIYKPTYAMENIQEIIAKSYDGILVTDAETNVLFVNAAYDRITGIKIRDMLGKSMRDLYNPVWLKKSVAETVAELGKSATSKQMTQIGTEIMVTGTPIFFEDGSIKMIVINVRNVDEIHRMQEELMKSQEMEKLYYHIDNTKEEVFAGEQIITVSRQMQDVFMKAGKICNFSANVLITGESGVGKEIVAKYIHENSLRRENLFIVINCGSIPANLLESELFGYTRGAFTGALAQGKVGLMEVADKGTLLLDEVGEMPFDLQVKLLRVLETKQITPVGAVKSKSVDVHILSATNRNLLEMVAQGKFREDLFYRLNVIDIHIPPLRERTEDIGPLCIYFVRKFNIQYGLNKKIAYDAIKELQAREWPGNIRQLKNVLENIVILSPGEYITCDDLPWLKEKKQRPGPGDETMPPEELTLRAAVAVVERRMISNAARLYKNTRAMAGKLGVHQSTLIRKMQRYGLNPR
jgi:PAS domain S-box-containing protein